MDERTERLHTNLMVITTLGLHGDSVDVSEYKSEPTKEGENFTIPFQMLLPSWDDIMSHMRTIEVLDFEGADALKENIWITIKAFERESVVTQMANLVRIWCRERNKDGNYGK